MKAKAIAKLVEAGHEDLAEQLLRAMPGSAPARIEDGQVKLPAYRGFDDQSPNYATAAKKLSDEDMVMVPGFGQMKLRQLKKQVVDKAEDLAKRAKRDQFQTIGQANLDTFSSMWKVLHDLQKKGQL
jgi:hypothetical protein